MTNANAPAGDWRCGVNMKRDLLGGIGAGAVSALLWASITLGGGGILLSYLSPLPLLMVGLSQGSRAGNIGIVAGVLISGMAGNPFFALIYIVMIGLPAGLIVRQALMTRQLQSGAVEWYKPGDLLAHLAGVASVLIIVAGFVHFDVDGGLPAAIGQYLDQILEARFNLASPGDRATLVVQLTPFFPAIIAGSWLLFLTINGTLAQSLMVRMGRNIRPTPAYSEIELPDWIYWAIVIAAGVALLSSGTADFVAMNVVAVLATPFFFVGLGTIHIMVRRLAAPIMALVGLYGIILVFGMVPFVAVAGLGFFEQWTDLRNRYGGARAPDEEEE